MEAVESKNTRPLIDMWADSLNDGSVLTGPQWLQDVRAQAKNHFLSKGLPGNKDEAWKYTSLRRLETLRPAISTKQAQQTTVDQKTPDTEQCDFGFSILGGQISLMDQPTPEGVDLQTLESILADPDSELLETLRPILQDINLNSRSQAFEAINTAMLTSGVVIRVNADVDGGSCLAQWWNDSGTASQMAHSRLIVILESGAKLRLVEQYDHFQSETTSSDKESADSGQANNLVIQIQLENDASLEHVRLQNTGIDDVMFTFSDITQNQNSSYQYSGFDVGGGLVRHQLSCRLVGEDARAEVNGAFILNGQQHVDNHICIEHLAMGTTSDQFFRGVLNGHSRAVFNGKSVIAPGADGSKIRQSNANLLLSAWAEIDTKPELEIYADEVEASHGATVGQLDEQAIFYMRTRGLTEFEARSLLVAAFCRGVSDRLNDRKLAGKAVSLLDSALPVLEHEHKELIK